jgi:hypothetical protein
VVALHEFYKVWSNDTYNTIIDHKIPLKADNMLIILEGIKEDGINNTTQIVKSTHGEDNAASACLKYKKGGLQWYLPTLSELYFMCLYKDEINSILKQSSKMGYQVDLISERGGYWSSSEYNIWNAWASLGFISRDLKYWEHYVRPISTAPAL